MSTYKYTLGADPELLVRDIGNNALVPVCGKVGGTKKNPLPFLDSKNRVISGYNYQEDNVAFEVNIPPARTAPDFVLFIRNVLLISKSLLATKGLKYDLFKSAHRFNSSELATEQAQIIGCDPDICAYGGKDDEPRVREPFTIKDLGCWRFTGGHLHLGYSPDLGIPPHVVARLMDALVYLPLIHKDKQKMRRPMYGLAGLYRTKPYGIEYRTMSNFWLQNPSDVADAAFHLLYDMHANLELLNTFYQDVDIDAVRKCIDGGGVGQREVMDNIRKLKSFPRLNCSINFMGHPARTISRVYG